MSKFKPKEIFIPTVSLFIICLIITALLAYTNSLTTEPIEKQNQLKAQQSRELVLAVAKDFEPVDEENDCYKGVDQNGAVVGYTLTTKAKGYGGDVQVMVGIDSKTNAVSGVVVLSHNETPGLGANAAKAEFSDQYKQPVPDNGFTVIKNAEPKDGEIQALTGATITSKAVTTAVNDALNFYNTKLKGGAN